MRWARFTIVALVGIALSATSAFAMRQAMPDERIGITAAVGITDDCLIANISTVDPNWAVADSYADPPCVSGPEYVLQKSASGEWSKVLELAAYGPCPVESVPAAVAADLYLCTSVADRRTYLPCLRGRSSYPRLVAKPRTCDTLTPERSFGDSANLAGIKWRSWGKSVATGTARERGYHLPFSRIRVRLRASHPWISCVDGRPYYRKLRVTSRYGTTTVPLYERCELLAMQTTFRKAVTADLGRYAGYDVKVGKATCGILKGLSWRCSADASHTVDRPIRDTEGRDTGFYTTEQCDYEYSGTVDPLGAVRLADVFCEPR